MPSRILKETICTSEEIDGLAWDEEVFFYRLMVNCDDFGRFDARPQILRAKLYPLKVDKLKSKDVERYLGALVRGKLAHVYLVGDRPYLQMITWDKHQQKRAKHSKYPGLDDAWVCLISSDIKCNQLIANVPVFEKRETRNEKRDIEISRSDFDAEFATWWLGYPLKKGKAEARNSWEKLRTNGKTPEELAIYRDRYKVEIKDKKTAAKYILYASTFLNGRWKDYEEGDSDNGIADDVTSEWIALEAGRSK